MLGLRRGEVALYDHQTEWEAIAAATIQNLKELFGDTALDIQHIGSTAVRHIKAKPIIDIAVGVARLDQLTDALSRLNQSGRYKRSHNRLSDDLLYVCVCDDGGFRTHQIHILQIESAQWRNYADFRDYVNAFPEKAKEYERLKIELAKKYPNVMRDYTDGKRAFMEKALWEAHIYARERPAAIPSFNYA